MNLLWRPMTASGIPGWAALLAASERVDDLGENYSERGRPPRGVGRSRAGRRARDDRGARRRLARGLLLAAQANHAGGRYRLPTEGTVHPDWRGRGIGTELLARVSDRAAELHRQRHPELTGEVNVSCGEHNAEWRSVIDAAGFEATRWFFEMERTIAADAELGQQPLPDGLRLEPYDARYDEAVRLAHNDAFRDHWGSGEIDPVGWKQWCTGSSWFRPALSCLVLDGDEVVGYLLAKEFEADTEATGVRSIWFDSIGVRRTWRGNRLATAMLLRALADSRSAGFPAAQLAVDAASPTGALGVYQRCGFTVRRRNSIHSRVLSVTD